MLGVSNMAGTFNFIRNMKNSLVYILVFAALVLICYSAYKEREYSTVRFITSSPVEEMYHRQLVVTLDSILDARFGTGCEEDIDTVNANTFRTHFSGSLSPMD